MKRAAVFIRHSVVLAVLFLVTLYFGHRYLEKTLVGSDIAQHLFETSTILTHFPSVPLWSPEQGGGFSYQGVNYGAYWLTAAYAAFVRIPPEVAIKLFSFLSPLLTAFGIYLIAKRMLHSSLGGIIAGFFFLISEISWFWNTEIGLYPFSVTFPLFPFFFLFFDHLV